MALIPTDTISHCWVQSSPMNSFLRGITLAFNPAGARRRQNEPDVWTSAMSHLATSIARVKKFEHDYPVNSDPVESGPVGLASVDTSAELPRVLHHR